MAGCIAPLPLQRETVARARSSAGADRRCDGITRMQTVCPPDLVWPGGAPYHECPTRCGISDHMADRQNPPFRYILLPHSRRRRGQCCGPTLHSPFLCAGADHSLSTAADTSSPENQR